MRAHGWNNWEKQRAILQAIATGISLPEIVHLILGLLEEERPDMIGSLTLIDSINRVVKETISISLPPSLSAGFEGQPIGPSAGSCGTAAHRRETVIVSDIATDPLWIDYKDFALSHGLKACWSTPVLLPNGEVAATFAVYYREVRDPDEASLLMVDAAVDMARLAIVRHRADEALKAEQAQQAIILDSVPALIFYKNRAGQLIRVNEAFCQFIGLAKSAIEGRKAEDLFLKESDSFNNFDEEVISSGVSCRQLEAEVVTPSGHRVLRMDKVPHRDGAGKIVGLVGFALDITSANQAEDLLKEQAALLNYARDAIIVRDLEDRIQYWNRGAEQVYGWKAQEVLGKKITDLIWRDLTQFDEAKSLTIKNGAWAGDISQINRAGDVVLVSARWTILKGRRGEPKGILAINTDVTEKAQIQAQFLRSQRMESIGTLAGGVAHDLNNVLTPILMSSELLAMGVSSEENSSLIQSIDACARRAAEMVRQLLSFARGIEGNRINVDVGGILADVARIARDTFPKAIKVELSLARGYQQVLGDPTQIHQLVLNLCLNARDAMPEGGTLTIRLELDKPKPSLPYFSEGTASTQHIAVKIIDTGQGIPLGIREKIFDPFFTTKPLGKGTGLGLWTAQAIAKNHAGFLDVESEIGKGSTFTVYLPFQKEPLLEAPAASSAPKVVRNGKGELLLIVDDEQSILNSFERTLRAAGYRTILARNGLEGVTAYKSRTAEISLVVSDMMMPIMNGETMIEKLVEINPNVVVIATSGLAQEDELSFLAASAVEKFISKPFSSETMLTAIYEALHRNQHRAPEVL